MKKYLLLIPVLCLSVYAQAQMDSLIYGLARNSSPEQIFLAKINPSTGVATNVSSVSVAKGEQIPDATIDPYNKIYYFVDTAAHIVGLNLLTGTIASTHLMTDVDSLIHEQFLYNCGDSTIYLIGSNSSPASVYLEKVNPNTGVVTRISSSSVATGIQIPDATIDPYNKIYYFANQSGYIVGLDLLTGAVVSSHLMANSLGTYFTQFLFNCSDSTLYGLASTSSPDAVFLAKIDPSTGVITNISASSVATGEQVPNATIDPFNMIYYFVDMTGKIAALNLTTGNIVSSNTMTNTGAAYFDQMLFNTNYIPRSFTAGIENVNTKTITNIYPVPASNALNIETLQTGNYSVELINSLGQTVLTNQYSAVKNIQLNISKFKNGIYLLKISTSKGIDVTKIIVEN